jgi:hypothetical protein
VLRDVNEFRDDPNLLCVRTATWLNKRERLSPLEEVEGLRKKWQL